MKRWHVLFLLALLPLVYAASTSYEKSRPKPYYLVKPHVPWENAGNLTATQATLAVTARDFSEVWTDLTDAKTIKYVIPNWADNVEMRFETTADADAHVLELWGAASKTRADGSTEENFTLMGSLALTGGTQTGSNSNVFVDTIVVTDGSWDMTAVDSAGNRICTVTVPTKGYKYIVGIATTFEAATTLTCDVRWF